MSHQPWEKWKLDAQFLKELDRWASQNPETSLDKVLKQVCDAIERGKEFFEVIPDGAFPARGLVKGLAQLIQFGKTFATAKADVHSFANEVVQWVTNIREAFATGRRNWMKGHFTRTTWRSLERIRTIIDEICDWAAARLSDKRWSLATAWQKLHVSGAIADFKKRISEARVIFQEAAIIHQSRVFDAILQTIGVLTKGQRRLEKMLLRIQKTQTEQLNEIIMKLELADDERRLAEATKERRQYVEQMLSGHTVADPTYIAQEKAPCDENTRVGVLASIDRWMWDISPGSQNFFWLSGNPGCGKSAITASLAKHSKSKDILWAQFFVNRNNPETTDPNKYFPTIAHQLSQRSEVVAHEIHDRLKANHTLLDGVSSEQVAGLFIDAVRVAARLSHDKPIVIVIDGLDETDKRHLRSIALIFARLFDALPDSPNVKVFISSRKDDDIQTQFAGSTNHVRTLYLDTEHPSSISDVTLYLQSRIAQIVLDYDLDWDQWPGDEGFSLLAKHTSGLFIWAVTAVKFFRQEIEDWGRERLASLLDDLNSKGMIDIDTLYGFILITTYKNQMKDQRDLQWATETFRRLVGAILVLYEPLSLHDLSKILDLRQTPSSPAVDVIRFVKRLRTVLVVGAGIIQSRTIPRLHKSFYEYLISERVDPQFRVDMHSSHYELAIKCLLQLASANSVISGFKMPLVYRYACRFWSQHMNYQIPGLRSGILVSHPLGPLNVHDIGTFLQHSSRKPVTPPILLTVSSSSIVASVLDQSCEWDIKNGLAQGGVSLQVIETTELDDRHMGRFPVRELIHNPPVIGGSPPDRQCIHYATSYCGISGGHETMQIGFWSPERKTKTTLVTLGENESILSGSTFQNGYFADAMFNGIHIRNIQVGPLRNMNCETVCTVYQSGVERWKTSHLALSPLGRFLAIGYVDGSLHFWNVLKDTPAGTFSSSVDEDPSKITVVVFSRDEAKALSCSEGEKHMTLWTLAHGKFHRSVSLKGSSSVINIAAFSPDSVTALSGHDDGTIHFWDVFAGKRSKPSMREEISRVSVLQYSDDGESIISGTNHGQLTLWDAETRSKIFSFAMNNDFNNGISACFLPGGQLCGATPDRMIVFNVYGKYTDLKFGREAARVFFFPSGAIQMLSPSSGGKIRLRNLNCQEQEWITLESKKLTHLRNCAFSPNGARVAASAENGAIYLWDAGTGRLIASSRPGVAISAFAIRKTQDDDMFFSPDNELLTVSGEKVLLWEVINRKLICVPSSLPNPSPFFQESEYDLDNVITQHNMQWIPSKRNDSGLWIFAGDHVIRARQDGTLIIAQLDRTVLEENR
ncbi:hypothetical protein C0993_007266 [Termitomyces sp. T159_Od127]|nr:hypothetical protein C0993_007266 [Termitomyces sp. T159_Od127]